LFYGLSAQSAARYLRTGKGQTWFNRVSAGLFGTAGTAALISH
jgi:threonine/homoserine/homoserine lactone efflux protein